MKETKKLKYRHEFKYVVNTAQIEMLKNRINHLLSSDSHTDDTGKYLIRSLYFDDYYNRCFYENENGTDPREKFRIRIYNRSSERIMLECKRKESGKTLKSSCPLTIEQTKLLMDNKIIPDIENQHPLLRKLTLMMMQTKMHPVVIVEYERIPYVFKDGNVRVTFDMNISSSNAIKSFLDKDIPKRPIMSLGQQILEVKYDEFLPKFIYNNLQLGELRQTAFSKYYLCRKFNL